MKHRLYPCSVLLALIAFSLPSRAATYEWDGTAGNGLFTGANWTINAGSPGQTITPETPNGGGDPVDWELQGHNISIDGGVINEDFQLKLDGGTFDVSSGSNVAFLPVSGSQNLSGLNLGQSNTPTIASVTDSILTASRSNDSGEDEGDWALRLFDGSSLVADNSTINVQAELVDGDLDLREASVLTLTNNSILNVEGGMFLRTTGSTMNVTDAAVNASYIRTDDDSSVVFDTGSITLSDANPLRSVNGFNGTDWNWIGDPGDGMITHTNPSDPGSSLGFKASQGLFSIDGVRINPTTNPEVDGVAAFNADLESLAVNGRFFQFTDSGATQELFLVEGDLPTLQVFTDTGLARIVNDTSSTFDLASYQISSLDVEDDGGSLDPNGWLSFEDRSLTAFPAGDGTGNGWEEGGNPSDTFVIESNLLGPTSSLAPGEMVALGELFAVGNTEDLEFLFYDPSQPAPTVGKIEYLTTTPLEADFDEDGDVDATDLSIWQSGYGVTGSAQKSDGDADFDGDVDGLDFLIWQRQVGSDISLSPNAATVPEPSSTVIMAIGLAALCVTLRPSNRRKLFTLLLLVLVGGVSVDAKAQQPNIIFIMADDLGFADTSNTLTTLGDPSDFYETPKLAELAAEGMAFTNAYANQNCAPTRTAILSGAYAPRSTNNVYQVGTLNRGGSGTLLVGPNQGTTGSNDKLPTATITHAETLQTAGYTTAYIGKFHVTDSESLITSDHGFDFNYGGGTAGGPGDYHASGGTFGGSIGAGLDPYAANYTQTYVDANIKPYANGTSLAAIDALVGTAKHVTDASADAAIDFMTNEVGSDPFFIQYSSHAVHTPIGDSQARDDLLNKYNNKTPGSEDSNESFGALIEGLDQSVARIVDFLENTSDPRSADPNAVLADNTILVFYSDNGGRQNQSNNSNLKGQKGELDEGGIRVPMIAWSANPSLVDGGTVNHTPVMPIDFYKTFANLGGATLPGSQTLDGEDLTAILADNTADLGRENVYWHLPGYLISGGRDQSPQTVVRQGDWKLMYNYEDQSYELYDLATDPSETTNLADANDAIVDDLSTDIINWLDDVDAPLATLRSGSLDLFITGQAYANGVITNYSFETITINAGEEVPLIVDLSPADADTNMDGTVNVLDWIAFKAGQGQEMAGFTLEQSFMAGDIDHDLDNDIYDFIAFRTNYDLVNGTGAFAAIQSIPEPYSCALLMSAAVIILSGRRRAQLD